MPAGEIADPTLGAQFHEQQVRGMLVRYEETLELFVKLLMQDGRLPGDVLTSDPQEKFEEAMLWHFYFQQRAAAGEQLSPREQAKWVESWEYIEDYTYGRRNGETET